METMSVLRAIEIVKNEQQCVERQNTELCNRNCGECDLVLTDEEILMAYHMAINALEFQKRLEEN